MARNLQHVLAAVGLNDKEAQLYLVGLKRGSAPASEYAKRSGLNRITTYNTLEEMVQRGLITVERKMRAKWYAPVSPEYLAVEARKNVDALDRVLPELSSLQGGSYRQPNVRFFQGWEGVRKLYDDSLTAETEILNFANSALVRRFWPEYDEEYVQERVKRGVRLRGIAPDDAAGKRVQGQDRLNLREIRLVPARDFHFNNEVHIYDHKVGIVSFGDGQDLFGVILESKEVADTQRQIFEMAWRYSGILAGRKTPSFGRRKIA